MVKDIYKVKADFAKNFGYELFDDLESAEKFAESNEEVCGIYEWNEEYEEWIFLKCM